jgi:hypothetical protein
MSVSHRVAKGVAGPAVPELERVDVAADQGCGLGVGEVVPEHELQRLSIGGPQPAHGGEDLVDARVG